MTYRHAIILGGGMAGMAASQVLAAFIDHVTVIEKDPQFSRLQHSHRLGIPQSHHLHVLLQHGQELLENIFPGILQLLDKLGSHTIDWSLHTKWYTTKGLFPRRQSSIRTLSFSRACLDLLMRERILQTSNIRLIQGFVKSFQTQRNQIIGIQYLDHHYQVKQLRADLIIDTRGRQSNLSTLLGKAGYQIPTPEIIPNKLFYASRFYQIGEEFNARTTKQIYIQPQLGRPGVVLTPQEQNKLVITLIGDKSAHQINEHAFERHLFNFEDHEIKHYLQHAKQISKLRFYKNLNSTHYHFSRMPE